MNLDLSKEEQAHVRAGVQFLHTRTGTWDDLAKMLKLGRQHLVDVVHGKPVTPKLAFRVARFAGISIDDLLTGKFPPDGTCPFCGHTKEET